jgi:hypothetical protein
MSIHELTFTYNKSTKNTHRFSEDERDGHPKVIEQMYIPKHLVSGDPTTCRPKVRIEL